MSTPPGSSRSLLIYCAIVAILALIVLGCLEYFGAPSAEVESTESIINTNEANLAPAVNLSRPSYDPPPSAPLGAYPASISFGQQDIRCNREQDANKHWDGFDMSLRQCAHTYCVNGKTVDEAMRLCKKENPDR